jgi:hypothetical protein
MWWRVTLELVWTHPLIHRVVMLWYLCRKPNSCETIPPGYKISAYAGMAHQEFKATNGKAPCYQFTVSYSGPEDTRCQDTFTSDFSVRQNIGRVAYRTFDDFVKTFEDFAKSSESGVRSIENLLQELAARTRRIE